MTSLHAPLMPAAAAVMAATAPMQPWNERGVLLDAADVHLSSETVGSGRLGSVLRGTWLGQPVAIKKVLPAAERRISPETSALLEHEVRALMPHLVHPCLLPLYGLCTDSDGALFLVFKLGEQGSLRDALRSARPSRSGGSGGLPLRDILAIASGVASALAFLHSARVVYRELKPGSIILDGSGNPLLDPEVGVIRAILQTVGAYQTQTAKSTIGGSFVHDAAYNAPELFEPGGEHALEPAVDVYSFGIVLLEMLTGVQPFPGLRALDIAAKHAVGERPVIPDTVPEPLAAIVRSCTQVEPARRPSARQVLSDVEAARKVLLAGASAAGAAPAAAPVAASAPAPAPAGAALLTSLFHRP